MKQTLNAPLIRLRMELCTDNNSYCRICFQGGPNASLQNPPNVFRNQVDGAQPIYFFVFDKPNDNDQLRAKGFEAAPVEILDHRFPENPTRQNLIKLLRILGIVEDDVETSEALSSSKFHITNAVKCDKCAVSGKTGQIEISPSQAEQCKRHFFYRELALLKPAALIMFGANPDKFITGRVGKSWVVRNETIDGRVYKVVRVPHTTATPFNTHGKCGHAYKEKLSGFWESTTDRK